ncbi:hypothetical protein B0T14DRAFT_141113 [Immersiella caudata]|uniref:Uncharacterized protein n=1 Tax=Immersiella caudata TaxID=314043 RepID=A0AA40C7A9_9PEZI|nr:hypothetical protein B0T14DRAFT_141113 [Immersiella caudata]
MRKGNDNVRYLDARLPSWVNFGSSRRGECAKSRVYIGVSFLCLWYGGHQKFDIDTTGMASRHQYFDESIVLEAGSWAEADLGPFSRPPPPPPTCPRQPEQQQITHPVQCSDAETTLSATQQAIKEEQKKAQPQEKAQEVQGQSPRQPGRRPSDIDSTTTSPLESWSEPDVDEKQPADQSTNWLLACLSVRPVVPNVCGIKRFGESASPCIILLRRYQGADWNWE